MKIRNMGANETFVWVNGYLFLLSYDTYVAFSKDGKYFITDVNYGRTTNRHINRFLNNHKANAVSQDAINEVVESQGIKIHDPELKF